MYITIDMVFRKQHIRCFVQSLSIHKKRQDGIIEFASNDKLNNVIRAYLVKPKDNVRPLFGKEVVKIIVPLNGRQKNYLYHSHLPKSEWSNLESDFEDLFFRMFYEIEISASMIGGKRKFVREKFLTMCGITEDVMSEDSFRKSFDRFLEKKRSKIDHFLQNKEISLASLYSSVV